MQKVIETNGLPEAMVRLNIYAEKDREDVDGRISIRKPRRGDSYEVLR